MRTSQAYSVLVLVTASLLVPFVAWGQAVTPPAAPPAGAPAPATPAGAGSVAAVVLLVVGLLVIVGIGVKIFDLKRKRETEAVHLQAQVSDALLRDQSLFGLPVTPTAHIPLWSGSPATLEITGEVPSRDLAERVMRISEQEASRVRSDVIVENRLTMAEVARAA
jgi:hypothetical protein